MRFFPLLALFALISTATASAPLGSSCSTDSDCTSGNCVPNYETGTDGICKVPCVGAENGPYQCGSCCLTPASQTHCGIRLPLVDFDFGECGGYWAPCGSDSQCTTGLVCRYESWYSQNLCQAAV